MRLISLTANKDSFRPVYFNPTGLTLIVGRQKEPENQDARKTYNGVGKSLLIALIHFCLGSGTNTKLQDAIPGWEFSLEFEIGGKKYTSTRSVDNQTRIILNDDEFALGKFNAQLEPLVFNLPSKIKGLTFKSLLNRFIRPGKASYVSFDKVQDKETDYYKLLCQSFLLGLDVNLVIDKYELKTKRDKIKEFRENLSSDVVFKEFFTENKDIDIELKDLDERIDRLTSDLNRFQVAENFNDIKKQAADTRRHLITSQNNQVVLTNAIRNIDLSLEVRGDIAPEKLVRIYNEARAKLPDSVVKEIQDLSEFHRALIANRVKRLNEEKKRLEEKLKTVQKSIEILSEKRNSELRFLGAHGAFDDMVSVSNQLTDFKIKARKIRDYKELLQKYSDETQEINIDLINETKKTNLYLEESKSLVDENLERFRSFSKRFYSDKPGGLTVKNNEGDNQLRFNINAHIQDDASDGINEVKIFCFDMTLFARRHNHEVDFVFHDSRLFSDMDPRQRATSFRIANEYTKATGRQYIATLNEDQIASMKEWFNGDLESEITDNIVLELTDESPESKLLGIEVDMQYE